ncbi:hypothetical protein ABL78_4095 [Leptomonas seymouri]|uniref:Uncharacterized protein n=1 Tax=Leptomonas seymouri TaxID=5684 RepID=A0A0N1HYP6_LEPSE|nr:hypothetical protein ABL78_4095 [Leptomonas seymouri]|eukprot:KPI86818.1 hypothetical protein ABL78_4095 [Leptomonas seymouri]
MKALHVHAVHLRREKGVTPQRHTGEERAEQLADALLHRSLETEGFLCSCNLLCAAASELCKGAVLQRL